MIMHYGLNNLIMITLYDIYDDNIIHNLIDNIPKSLQ